MSFNTGSVSSKGGHSKLIRTRTCTGKGDVVAFGFFENAVGDIFIIAGVNASNIPNNNRSVTLNRNIVVPTSIPDAEACICAGNPKIPNPKHSSIVSELQPNRYPGPGIMGHAISFSFIGARSSIPY